MPRLGEELPEQVADWVCQARLKLSKEYFVKKRVAKEK
jgi:hypothetical protein